MAIQIRGSIVTGNRVQVPQVTKAYKNQSIILQCTLYSYFILYSTPLLQLQPLRFHWVGGCWDQTKDCCTLALTVRYHSAKSQPLSAISHQLSAISHPHRLYLITLGYISFTTARSYLHSARTHHKNL
jgi:hypothetical protein